MPHLVQHFCCAHVANFELKRSLVYLVKLNRSSKVGVVSWHFEQDVLWLEISVGDTLGVHVLEPVEDLTHVGFDLLHGHRLLVLLSVAQFILEAAVAELHHSVLNELILCTHRVEEVNHLDDVRTPLEETEDLILA